MSTCSGASGNVPINVTFFKLLKEQEARENTRPDMTASQLQLFLSKSEADFVQKPHWILKLHFVISQDCILFNNTYIRDKWKNSMEKTRHTLFFSVALIQTADEILILPKMRTTVYTS